MQTKQRCYAGMSQRDSLDVCNFLSSKKLIWIGATPSLDDDFASSSIWLNCVRVSDETFVSETFIIAANIKIANISIRAANEFACV